MGAYEPKFLYTDIITSTASATITGGQQLIVSGNGTVGPSSGASRAYVGVAAFDAVNTDRVSYFPRGKVHVSVASGGITAGDQVVCATGGKVATLAASAASGNAAGDIDTAVNNTRSIIGIALTTAADTANVEWMEI